MHNTGKIGIPDDVLKAPRKLTPEEWKTMQTHSQIGHEILSHHEKWDGNGYPNGSRKTDIPECARIVAIADIFDALTMKRPYKEA